MTGHTFRPGEQEAACVRCRSITRAEWWYDRDMTGVVTPCVGL